MTLALKGSLSDMSLSAVIQIACKNGKQSCLFVRSADRQIGLYFESGQIVHVIQDLDGEMDIDALLDWQDGEFELEMDVPPPERTIDAAWSNELLEGVCQVGERAAGWKGLERIGPQAVAAKEGADTLAGVLKQEMAASANIESGAVIGADGVVLSAATTGKLDEDALGAQAAAFYGIAKRTSAQLGRGTLYQAVIQSDKGSIVVTVIDEHTMFVGTTARDAVLGMIFREAQEIAAKIGLLGSKRSLSQMGTTRSSEP